MDPNSKEFQDASQAAAERIRNLILEISQSPGQNDRTALTGAFAAIAELQIQIRPKGMEEEKAIAAGAQTFLIYAAQYLNGCGIDYDKAIN